MKVLGLDIETGGNFADPIEKNFITEIGVVLWDTVLQQPVKMFSAIIKDGPESSPEAVDYTGITNEMRQAYGVGLNETLFKVLELMKEADYIMAHNGETFDKPIILTAIEKILLEGKNNSTFPKNIWIDSLIDIEYAKKYTNNNLTYLKGAKELTYPGHRAIFDVIAMLQINLTIREIDDIKCDHLREQYAKLQQTCIEDNVCQMVNSANSPMVTVRACVTFQDLEGREAAKKEKFHWDGNAKLWTRQIRKSKLDKVAWPFIWQVLQ
jgi:DNA polymerase-3 subunit epsilon